jgi:hypothetical protein
MYDQLETTGAPRPSLYSLTMNGPGMLVMFWLLAGAIGLWATISYVNRPDSFAGQAILVALAALLPMYLWCARRVPGHPVFPLFASAFLMTHVFPLLRPTPRLLGYSDGAVWAAAATVAGFLCLATAVWWICTTRPRHVPQTCLSVGGDRGHSLYLVILCATTALSIATNGDWLSQISEGIFTTLRGFIRGLGGVAILMLAMNWGERRLSPSAVKLFVTLFVLFCIADGASLFLVGAIVGCLMLGIGFVLGRGRLPLISLVALVIFGLLHLGKGPMRERYWPEGGQGHVIQPLQYPGLYAEWLRASLEELRAAGDEDDGAASIFSRTNGINILLQVQEMSPQVVPYVGGATYAIIPSSLLPRLFFPEKESPHMGSAILNVHYGNQTWESAQSTTIGWGLLNESIGNFGHVGWIVLALCLGVFYGAITRMSIGLPTTSIPSLVGIFTMGFAVQTEWTASVFLSAYAQGLFSFLAVALVFARRVRVDANGAEADSASMGWDAPYAVVD